MPSARRFFERSLISLSVVSVVAAIALPQVAAQSTDDLFALNQQVGQLYEQGKYAEAIPIAERALVIAEERFRADDIKVGITLNNLAALYDKQGRTGHAAPLLMRAQAIRQAAAREEQASTKTRPKISIPTLSTVLYARYVQLWSEGAAAFDKGEFDRAIVAYGKALAIVPKDVVALDNRGIAYQSKGDYERSIADYTKAIAIDPNYAYAYNSRAWAYFKLGKADQGLPDAGRAVELAPGNAFIRDTRGQIYAALGRREEAIWDLQQALFLAPELQESIDALKRLGAAAIAPAQVKPHVQIVPQLGHSSRVYSVAFSSDGTRVLTGSDDSTAKLWDVGTGQLLRTFTGHSSSVSSVAFSPDGTRVLTGSQDNTAKLWDAGTGKLLRTFTGHSSWVKSVAFSPDGARVLTGSWDNTAKLWDAGTGKLIRTFEGHSDYVNSVAFSPDGTRVLTGSGMIISESKDYTAKLWDAGTGELFATFKGHTKGVTSVAFSPDGTRVLTGSGDKTAKLWDAGTGKLIRTFERHSYQVMTSVAFSPDGARVLTGDDNPKLWDANTGQLLKTFTWGLTPYSVAFSPDGARVLAGGGLGKATLWDADTGEPLRTFMGPSHVISSVAFSPDGTQMLTGSWDNIAKLWETRTGQLLRAFTGHAGFINSVAFSPDGGRVLIGSGDDTAKLWDAGTGELLTTFTGHSNSVNSVAFSPDGARVLTGSSDDSAKAWDADTGELFTTFKGHSGAVTSVAFSPDGTRVLTGGGIGDHTAKLWDAGAGELLATFKGHSREVESVALSPDGAQVLTGSSDTSAKLWDADTGKLIRTFEGHSDSVIEVSFSPNGASVLTGSWDRTAKLWDTETGKLLKTFEGHSLGVTSVAFSPDGARLLTGSKDGTAKLWDASTGKREPLLVSMIGGSDDEWLSMTPAGFFAGSHLGRDGNKLLSVVRGLEPYSVTQFFDHLYSPELVAQRLKGDPERKYKNAASKLNLEKILNSGNAPEIQTIPGKKTELIGDSVRATVRLVDDGGKIGDKVVWRVNGVTKETSHREKTENAGEPWLVTETLSVNPFKKNVIEVTAYNGAGLLATRPFRFEVDKFGTSTEEEPRPTMYVLALGVSDYVRDDWDLTYAKSDAETIGARLKRAAKDLYEDVDVTVLKDNEVTREGIEAAFKTLKSKVKPTDVFVLFVAGHGRNVTEKYYFIPHDLTFDGGKSVEDGIGQDTWQSWLKLIDAEKSILIFDTCESSGATVLTRGAQERETAVDRLRHATGRSIITAARQAAYEGYKGHGVLTWTILDALTGPEPEEIDLYRLAAHVDRKVPEITKSLFGIRQRPHNKIEGNFPIGVRLGLPTTSTDAGKDSPIPTAPNHVLIRPELVRKEPKQDAAGAPLDPGTQVYVVKLVGDWAMVAREGQKMGYVPQAALAKLK